MARGGEAGSKPLIDAYVDCHVAVITLNDGERGNLLGPSSLGELTAALAQSLGNPDVRAVLLRSNGPAFCLGMDLGRLAAGEAGGSREAEKAVGMYADLLASLFSAPLPVVCLVEGDVKAGGVGLVCACDIVLAGEGATFELGEVLFGLIPANVMPYMLSVRVPPQKVRSLVLGSERVSAAEALRLNLVDAVVPASQMERRLVDLFKRLLRSSPAALAQAKAFSAELLGKTPQASAARAREKLLEMIRDPSTLQGVRAFQKGDVPSWFSRFKPERPLSPGSGARAKEEKR
jgi:methylglutaconyl-CoA hydratase